MKKPKSLFLFAIFLSTSSILFCAQEKKKLKKSEPSKICQLVAYLFGGSNSDAPFCGNVDSPKAPPKAKKPLKIEIDGININTTLFWKTHRQFNMLTKQDHKNDNHSNYKTMKNLINGYSDTYASLALQGLKNLGFVDKESNSFNHQILLIIKTLLIEHEKNNNNTFLFSNKSKQSVNEFAYDEDSEMTDNDNNNNNNFNDNEFDDNELDDEMIDDTLLTNKFGNTSRANSASVPPLSNAPSNTSNQDTNNNDSASAPPPEPQNLTHADSVISNLSTFSNVTKVSNKSDSLMIVD